MRTTLLFLVTLFALPALAETYKWVDKNGVTHYSDRPIPGAVKVDVKEGSTYTPGPKPTTPRSLSSNGSPVQQYRVLDLWRPKNDEVFQNAGSTIGVSVRLDPALQSGHSIWIYMDGKRVDGLPGSGTDFQLNNVWRGTHTVVAVVTDSSGKTLISSPTVTFHVRQNSVLAPRSPAAPPKPAGK